MSLSHLISIRDLTREEAILILDTAEQMAATQRHGVKKLPTLQGKTVVNLFFEDSTRTRLSFEAAEKRLAPPSPTSPHLAPPCLRASRSRTPRRPSRRLPRMRS